MNTPVALIIFRRPELTARVLEVLARVKPRQLLVVADGPRPGRPDDVAACAATRAIIDRVDWECDVRRNFSATNLGCGLRPASGITWVFEQVEQAIILEDDCVPHPGFFPFCDELLARYRDDERVMHIAGSTYRHAPVPTPYSYCFSQFNGAWGWATWRRAWRHFDKALALWPELRETSWLADLIDDQQARRYWAEAFDRAHAEKGNVSYWDHQWTFACWANSGLSVLPHQNLVSNVGCGPEATHCADEDDIMADIPAAGISFPLRHPPVVLQSREVDRQFLHEVIVPRLAPRKARVRARFGRFTRRLCPEPVKRVFRRLSGRERGSLSPSHA